MTLIVNPDYFPDTDASFFIEGEQGRLELLTTCPENASSRFALRASQDKGVAVICHPHPLHQGTMTNKVVHTLSRAFHNQNLHTVRFNFRGVGKSEGSFGHSIGEVADLISVLKWVDTVLDTPNVWLAGFSFGAYIAAMGATKHPCCQLYSVAPAVNHQPYEKLLPITCPWIVIQGEKDEVISPELVYNWYEKVNKPNMQLIKLTCASHFFHGNLITLRSLIEKSFVSSC